MTVLLDKFVLEVLKSLPCLIVAWLDLPLEVDPDDGGSLPCYGLQLRPVWEVAPAGEREVYVVAVGDLLLSPDKEIIVLVLPAQARLTWWGRSPWCWTPQCWTCGNILCEFYEWEDSSWFYLKINSPNEKMIWSLAPHRNTEWLPSLAWGPPNTILKMT